MSETKIMRTVLALEGAETSEDVIACRGVYEAFKRRVKEIDAAYKEAELAAVERLGGVDLGDGRRLYVGTTKRTKCRDVAATLEGLLDATQGDVERIASCLSSNAWKHGACREYLSDWDEHFHVEEVKDVKTGKAKRAVQLADDRYSRKGG